MISINIIKIFTVALSVLMVLFLANCSGSNNNLTGTGECQWSFEVGSTQLSVSSNDGGRIVMALEKNGEEDYTQIQLQYPDQDFVFIFTFDKFMDSSLDPGEYALMSILGTIGTAEDGLTLYGYDNERDEFTVTLRLTENSSDRVAASVTGTVLEGDGTAEPIARQLEADFVMGRDHFIPVPGHQGTAALAGCP